MYTKGRWSKEEEAILIEYYSKGGVELCQQKGVNRDSKAIFAKANRLGIATPLRGDGVLWENWEDRIIEKYYKIGGSFFCKDMGLNREVGAIRNRAPKLGYKRVNINTVNIPNVYAEWEENVIRKYYPIGGVRECINRGLMRNESAILLKANKMGLKREGKINRSSDWSESEYELLKSLYPKYGVRGCIEGGLKRSDSAIRHKVSEIGLRMDVVVDWTAEEIAILKKYFPSEGAEGCISKGLKRSEGSILKRVNKIGLVREDGVTQKNGWSNTEEAILNKIYPIYGIKGCILEGVNRSERAIRHKVLSMGLKRVVKGDWTRKEDEILKHYYPKGGYKLCVSKGLKRKSDATRNRAKFWGLVYVK